MTQLWAQVKYLLESDFRYWFDTKENQQISDINDAFRVKPVEEELLLQFFEADEDGKPMMQTEILNFLQVRSSSKLNSRVLSTVLKKRGFIRKGVRINGSPRYVYLVRELSDEERRKMSRLIKGEIFAEEGFEKFKDS